jgi:hypothetical protein
MKTPTYNWWSPGHAFRRDGAKDDLQQRLMRLGLADALSPGQAKTMHLSPRSTLYKVVNAYKKRPSTQRTMVPSAKQKNTERMYELVTEALRTIPYNKDSSLVVGLDCVAHHLRIKPCTVRRIFQRGNLEGWCSQAKNVGPYDSHRDYTALSPYGWMSGWGPTYFRIDLERLRVCLGSTSEVTFEK